jgi:hypothetical protein
MGKRRANGDGSEKHGSEFERWCRMNLPECAVFRNPGVLDKAIEDCARNSPDRVTLWEALLGTFQSKTVLEIGVWKAQFAAHMLAKCSFIQTYYMIDPWRKLPAWNKPYNIENTAFDEVYKEAISAVAFAREKVRVFRGTTLEMVDQIQDETLEFAYIDGDHTLRGITLDLLNVWSKVKPGSYLAGDDLSPNIWQHSNAFEPTLIFPFALYFAEAMRATIYALPYQQFLIKKPAASGTSFTFIDLVGVYGNPALRDQLMNSKRPAVRKLVPELVKRVIRALR